MKRDYTALFKGLVGGKLAWYVRGYTDLATQIQNAIDERLNDPLKVDREIDDLSRANVERIRKSRRRSTHDAADEGDSLMEQKRKHGGGRGWLAFLKREGYSRRTAQNRIALALFRRYFPAEFERFSRLGVTKCTRIAMLPEPVVRSLDLQRPVDVGGKTTALEYLTDDQLIDFLREHFPVARRPRRNVLRTSLRAAERAVTSSVYPGPLSREDKEVARDAVKRMHDRLLEMLGTV